MNRAIFCAYWLYFCGFRAVLGGGSGGSRLWDYVAISFPVLGIMRFVSTGMLPFRLVGWVALVLCPLALAAILEPGADVCMFLLKECAVTIYVVAYVTIMRLTVVEFACFAVPVVVSVYFFACPTPSHALSLAEGRGSGISESNFTALSLIYAMGGAVGVYVLAKTLSAKIAAIVAALVCFWGVVWTASRAGFIAALLALCLFLVILNRMRYAGVAAALAAVIVVLYLGGAFQNEPLVLERFRMDRPQNDPGWATMHTGGRAHLLELAWDDIHSGEWFIGGGPQRVSEWGQHHGFGVPHNSLLDLGVAFGRARFYFYGALLVGLLAVNVRVLVRHWLRRDREEKNKVLASMLFLSLLPMYMSLSAGLTMDFIVWVTLGAYPLLHASSQLAEPPLKHDVRHHLTA